MKPILLALALVIGLMRPLLLFVTVNPHVQSSYEAVAHILVGILLGLWLRDRSQPWVMRTFWALNTIEVICAITGMLGYGVH